MSVVVEIPLNLYGTRYNMAHVINVWTGGFNVPDLLL